MTVRSKKTKQELQILSYGNFYEISEMIKTTPILSKKCQVAIVELENDMLIEKLIYFQRKLYPETIVKIFSLDSILPVRYLGRHKVKISNSVFQSLIYSCNDFEYKYFEYERQKDCEDMVAALSKEPTSLETEVMLAESLGDVCNGYSIIEP